MAKKDKAAAAAASGGSADAGGFSGDEGTRNAVGDTLPTVRSY